MLNCIVNDVCAATNAFYVNAETFLEPGIDVVGAPPVYPSEIRITVITTGSSHLVFYFVSVGYRHYVICQDFIPLTGTKYLTTIGANLTSCLFDVSVEMLKKLHSFSSSCSSSLAIGAITLVMIASHLVRADPNLDSNSFDINFEKQSDVLKLISCIAVWNAKVASLAAMESSFSAGSAFLKNDVVVDELDMALTLALCFEHFR